MQQAVSIGETENTYGLFDQWLLLTEHQTGGSDDQSISRKEINFHPLPEVRRRWAIL
jgi:hypothetical protein